MSPLNYYSVSKHPIVYIGLLFTLLIHLSHGTTFKEDVTLTRRQGEILSQFKEIMSDQLDHEYMKQDIYLIRWLRSRGFNINSAKAALSSHLSWRQENNMDKILEEEYPEFEENYKYYFQGKDKQQRPLLFYEIGTHNIRKAIIAGQLQTYKRYIDKKLEYCATLIRQYGEEYGNITRGQVVIDMAGYNLIEHGCLQCSQIFLLVVDRLNNHYPEIVEKMYIVNAPGVTGPMLNLVKPFLGPDLQNRVKIFGMNKRAWGEALSQDFDWNELPTVIGGNMVLID